MSDKQLKQTVIAEGVEFEGSLKSPCSVTLAGRLKGVVSAPALIVEASGAVEGRIEVAELRSAGQVSGQIVAKDVQLGGKVGDKTVIRAATLEVRFEPSSDARGVTFGECELRIGKAANAVTAEREPAAQPVERHGRGS